jgi:hypothetical protein
MSLEGRETSREDGASLIRLRSETRRRFAGEGRQGKDAARGRGSCIALDVDLWGAAKVRAAVMPSGVARPMTESLEVRRSHFTKDKEDGSNQNGPTSKVGSGEGQAKHERDDSRKAAQRRA